MFSSARSTDLLESCPRFDRILLILFILEEFTLFWNYKLETLKNFESQKRLDIFENLCLRRSLPKKPISTKGYNLLVL
jgi:hypothetical protein